MTTNEGVRTTMLVAVALWALLLVTRAWVERRRARRRERDRKSLAHITGARVWWIEKQGDNVWQREE